MNRALLELHGAGQLRRGLLPLSRHLSHLQSVNSSYAQSCCYPKLAQSYMHASCRALQLRQASHSSSSRHFHARSQIAQNFQAAQAHTLSPTRLQTLHAAVAANLPVFVFHPAERYFPCTVEWFLQRCELQLIRKGWKRSLLRVLCRQGELDGNALKAAQGQFNEEPDKKRKLMQLSLCPHARAGQADAINQVPVYAHVKEVVDPQGKLEAVEINYMKFLAFNGSYKLFDWIYIGEVGAHDGDWEHVTLRLTPDAGQVLGIYYSAHRHRDGRWVSANDMPRTPDGRPLSYVALNGHGSYPRAGFIPRIFLAFNDRTGQGQVWDPKECVLVTQDAVPQVTSRGSELDGSSYPSGHLAQNSPEVKLQQDPAAWLAYEGKWGSTVEAPALQEWFARAEHPVSRSWLAQVFFPLAPGIESIWEPFQEEVEERVQEVQRQIDEAMDDTWETAEEWKREVQHLQRRMENTSGEVRQMLQKQLHQLLRQKDKS
ncbi:TPA: hypothetical protein ACH3X3_003041 [Trebouxia sp. C0006]